MEAVTQQLLETTGLRPLDIHAALLVERLAGGDQPEVLICTALTSRALADGHTCLPLEALSGLLKEAGPIGEVIKNIGKLHTALTASGVVGSAGEGTPLILDEEGNLYLQRYYQYEQQIGEGLRFRAAIRPRYNLQQAQDLVERLFPGTRKAVEPNWQAIAAILSLLRSLLVISGGPGTGKTFTVARILALLTTLEPDMRIALATPTGKAAARLQESIRLALQTIPEELGTQVPDQAVTIHRLLGYRPGGRGFTYSDKNPLQLDLLIVDEASMVDVPLMAALIKALPGKCRLLLLGDRHQLASVEAGNLFGDICGSEQPAWSQQLYKDLTLFTDWSPEPVGLPHPLGDTVVTLRKSYRFNTASGIGWLADTINKGKAGSLVPLARNQFSDLAWCRPANNGQPLWLEEQIARMFTPIFQAENPENGLAALDRCRILCALREGPSGVFAVNRQVETVLHLSGLIGQLASGYRGKPIMITRNNYGLQLFNGDTGILWPDNHGQLYAWFRRPDGSLQPVVLSRLPEHQTGYAITVHKSQGSEFEEVLLRLPNSDAPVLTRELLYTGVTRAKKSLLLYTQEDILENAIQRGAARHSGLRSKLLPQ